MPHSRPAGQDVVGSPAGIEAVANGVPAFRQPRRRAQLMPDAMLIRRERGY
jgi:hypothetical protein